jgi:hypothetical protein
MYFISHYYKTILQNKVKIKEIIAPVVKMTRRLKNQDGNPGIITSAKALAPRPRIRVTIPIDGGMRRADGEFQDYADHLLEQLHQYRVNLVKLCRRPMGGQTVADKR